ncbi:hypothetical protein KP509_13G089400 [Ceratopteris richardii]|uniref:CCHC-type domain-containing protein n=1 Tax=Ceratopteris richardii TaxID=49495 RepID=A0A8T2TFM1_CERRI|nr:hypothetical protein KP509_13G089400 [Ceratopteris richardii]
MSEGSSSSGATQTQREECAQRRALERERKRWELQGESTSTSSRKSAKNVYSRRRVANQVQKFEGGILRPRALNFWDRSDIDITPLFEMAQWISVHLGDFTKFSGAWDEDPDSFIQLFEVTCEANEVVDQGQRLRIFLAILRDETANWYGNLTPQERGTYQMLKEAFWAKFQRQGFQDRLAQQMDYLRQGVNESIDNYIQRMETLEQARLWEEVQLCQQRKMELLYEPMGGPRNIPMKDPGQGSLTLTTPAFVAATSTPGEVKPALTEERILELVTQAIKAATVTQETYTVKPEVTTNPNQVFRSNTWCGKCHGYGHLASECPTVSRVFTDRSPPRMRCTFCGRTNHTEDRCYNKRAYEERTMKSGDTRERSYTGLPAQSVPPTSRWENRQTYGYGAQGQGGDYLKGVARDQRRDGPIQCWRCHGFGHTQSRCPNEKKPVDYTPLCRYYSGEGHFDEDCPKRRAAAGKEKGPVGSSNYVDTQMDAFHNKSSRARSYDRSSQEFEDGEEIEILPPVTKEFVPGIAPFPKRLRAPKCRKERQSLEEVDIVKLLADTEVTLNIGTLLKCSPAYRKQFYNEYIKKPRKDQDKKRQDKEVQGIIQSITTQIDSNAPAVTVEIKGYAVPGSQLDSGVVVNLMTEYMMKALGLDHMEETPMSLRMADQTQVKPAGLLKNVSTVVGGLELKVDYLIVRPRTSEATFSILLGRPWLVQAECVHDWRTGFITIGPKADRIQLQVSPNLTTNPWRRELQKMS